jgi:hypothetical protein
LLAADAVAGFQGFDVAGLAEIPNPKEPAVPDGVEMDYFETTIRLHEPFSANFPSQESFVFKSMKEPTCSGRKRIILAFSFQDRTCSLNYEQFTLQGLLGFTRILLAEG